MMNEKQLIDAKKQLEESKDETDVDTQPTRYITLSAQISSINKILEYEEE